MSLEDCQVVTTQEDDVEVTKYFRGKKLVAVRRISPNCEEWYDRYGNLHKKGGYSRRIKHGNYDRYESYKHGQLHSYNDEPAITSISFNGTILEETWYKYGKVYREIGPTHTYANIRYMQWMVQGCWINRWELDVQRSVPPEVIDALKILPLPISDAIIGVYEWTWTDWRKNNR